MPTATSWMSRRVPQKMQSVIFGGVAPSHASMGKERKHWVQVSITGASPVGVQTGLAYEPILARDANDRITYWNHGAERFYGYTWRQAKGQNSHELLCTKFPEPLHEIQSILKKRGFWEGELIHCTKDNRLIHVLSRWQKFSNDGMSILETSFDLS